MPFHVRDPWRVQYFTGVPCPAGVDVPVDDIDCWDWFPEYRFIYDKLFVARSQGVAAGTIAELPRHFPVFAKPRVNLKGMGKDSCILADAASFTAFMTPEHMWMELFRGEHVSTDCAVVQGKVMWSRDATGIAWHSGTFKHWIIHAAAQPALEDSLSTWIARSLPRYTGMINIETIGGRIIEAQLRFADQWCDLNGKGWLASVARLYASGSWSFDDSGRRDAYSVPLFARHGLVPPYPAADVQRDIRNMPGIASLQITYHEEKDGTDHAMPPGGFRLGIVNCWELEAGFAARRRLAEAFPGTDVMLP